VRSVEDIPTRAESGTGRATSIAAWILAAVAIACDIAYVWVIAEEGNFSFGWPVVVFVAAYAAGLGGAALAGRRAVDPRRRSGLLSWAAAGAIATGLVGAFSLVFVPLIPAGVFLFFVTSRSRTGGLSALWAALAVVVLIVGLLAAHAFEPG
jgi:hypothetical protein